MSYSSELPAGTTFFAPAGREAPEKLRDQVAAICDNPIAAFLLSSLQSFVAILNEHRQILAASPEVLGALGPRWDGACTGARLGEAFNCIHVQESPAGCGTSKACRHCGAVLAYLAAQTTQEPATGECELAMRLESGTWEAREFHVTATPLRVGPHRVTAMVLQDISSLKRREALERLFFHDMGNIIQGLLGWSESLSEGWVPPEEAARKILVISERLNREIHSHRRLLQAEQGQLRSHAATVEGVQILQELAAGVAQHPAAQGRPLRLDTPPGPGVFSTDPDLLLRVLYNMTINAYEATEAGGTVCATFEWRGDSPHFSVHNPGTIPPEVRPRIFHRSFSTKASLGRGLGTHAMKLFGENLLQGQVGYESSDKEGTTFWITLPRELVTA